MNNDILFYKNVALLLHFTWYKFQICLLFRFKWLKVWWAGFKNYSVPKYIDLWNVKNSIGSFKIVFLF